MKGIYCTFIGCLIITSLFAQRGTILISKPETPRSIKEADSTYSNHLFEWTTFSYEQKYFLADLDKQFKTIGNWNFAEPCNSISISNIGQFNVTRGDYSFPGYFIFSYILPSGIILNDSIKERLKGFNLKFSFAGQNIINKNHIGVFLTEGTVLGRLKIVNKKKEKLKNGIFAPYMGLVVRLTFSRLTVFAVSQFDYDLSSSYWKKTWISKKQDDKIMSFNQSGLNFSVGINFSLGKVYSKKKN